MIKIGELLSEGQKVIERETLEDFRTKLTSSSFLSKANYFPEGRLHCNGMGLDYRLRGLRVIPNSDTQVSFSVISMPRSSSLLGGNISSYTKLFQVQIREQVKMQWKKKRIMSYLKDSALASSLPYLVLTELHHLASSPDGSAWQVFSSPWLEFENDS